MMGALNSWNNTEVREGWKRQSISCLGVVFTKGTWWHDRRHNILSSVPNISLVSEEKIAKCWEEGLGLARCRGGDGNPGDEGLKDTWSDVSFSVSLFFCLSVWQIFSLREFIKTWPPSPQLHAPPWCQCGRRPWGNRWRCPRRASWPRPGSGQPAENGGDTWDDGSELEAPTPGHPTFLLLSFHQNSRPPKMAIKTPHKRGDLLEFVVVHLQPEHRLLLLCETLFSLVHLKKANIITNLKMMIIMLTP